MEQRYTALADEQGRLAAENERLLSENQRLAEVRDGCSRMQLHSPPATHGGTQPRPANSCSCHFQEQRAAKAEAHKLQTALMEKDAALQRKDVQVGCIRNTCCPSAFSGTTHESDANGQCVKGMRGTMACLRQLWHECLHQRCVGARGRSRCCTRTSGRWTRC